jgi:hypothetical protein
MTAEQVVRAAIIKQTEKCCYRDLAFLLFDSRVFGGFCKIGIGDKSFCKSALQRNITALSGDTREEIFIICPHSDELVIIFIIHEFCITSDKAKCNTPVGSPNATGMVTMKSGVYEILEPSKHI